MIRIQPQYLSLAELLAKRLFLIPDYQRAYSWGTDQRIDLFNDITKAYRKGKDEGHFMAAIVCLRRGQQTLGTDVYQKVDVVDGQQRLTTLLILLKAIQLELSSPENAETRLKQELQALLVKDEADELLLLQTNHDSSHHFANFMRHATAPPSATAKTIADKQILLAIEECQRFVQDWQGNSLLELATLLKNRLYLLLHEIEEERSVYTVFEVLNSRGLEVSWFDRLKSMLMGNAFELEGVDQQSLIDDLHRIWREIYQVIGLRQGLSTEALRFAATLQSGLALSRLLNEEDSVKEISSKAQTPKSLRDAGLWILDVVKACDLVRENPRHNAVTRIVQARLLAVAIHLRKDLSVSERTDLLALWEKTSFRIYGMYRNDARTAVGEYVRLARLIIQHKPGLDEVAERIKALSNGYPIEKAIEVMTSANAYDGWSPELRYFFFRYEEYLARVSGQNFKNEQWEKIWMSSPSDSIEHILPQSRASEDIKHNLGNLVLLPPKLNSRLQALPPKQKAPSYVQTGLLIAQEVAQETTSGTWTKAKIRDREKALLEWAQTEWGD